MTVSEVVPLAGLATTTFMAGLLWVFSSSVMPAIRSIDTGQGMAAMNVVNRKIVEPMFVVALLGSVASAVAAIVLALDSVGDDAWLLAAGGIHLIGFVGVTATVHLPLNAEFAALGESPKDLAAFEVGVERWTTFNHVRAAAAVLASVAYTIHLGQLLASPV